MRKAILFLLLSFLVLAGCSVNPVTGKREMVLMSTAQEIEMGRQNYMPMQQSQGGKYDIDPALTTYVQRVGSKVAAQSGVDLPYEFVVLNNSVPNAWALPGGKIAINRGLLTELESEAELAAVLGHEAVHAAARHSAQQQSRAMIMQVGVLGTAIGLLLGFAVCEGLLIYGFPLDPKVYFISRLPVQVRPFEFVVTGLVAIVICLVATIIPSLYAAGLRPADGFRQQ